MHVSLKSKIVNIERKYKILITCGMWESAKLKQKEQIANLFSNSIRFLGLTLLELAENIVLTALTHRSKEENCQQSLHLEHVRPSTAQNCSFYRQTLFLLTFALQHPMQASDVSFSICVYSALIRQ